MVLDSKLDLLRFHFSITNPEDWTKVTPQEILAQDGIGEATLDHLRYLLAGQGLTLKGDQSPSFWQSRLVKSRLGTFVRKDEDREALCPFTILIDEQEKHPFTFVGITADAQDGARPLIVPTERKTLGPSHGDYSIVGHEGYCHIERKSIDDAISTILGWGDRRERFEKTLTFLSSCHTSFVVVEASFGAMLRAAYETKGKTAQQNKKILHRQVMAWMSDYPVPWLFCDTPRFAELSTFQILRRHHKKSIERNKGKR